MTSTGWANFWENQTHSFKTVMKIATNFFAIKIEKRFQIKQSDKILDYGCGPGFLADYLVAKNISLTGADINKFYIEKSKKNHPGSLFIQITSDRTSNEKILENQLKKGEFDFVILLSISQYFESVSELEAVIKMLVPFTKDQGKLIIADVIDPHTSPLCDAASLLFQCIKNGQPLAFFRFISYLLFSNYRRISKNTQLLKISEESFRKMASDNRFSCEKVDGLTIHASRVSYVLSKTN